MADRFVGARNRGSAGAVVTNALMRLLSHHGWRRAAFDDILTCKLMKEVSTPMLKFFPVFELGMQPGDESHAGDRSTPAPPPPRPPFSLHSVAVCTTRSRVPAASIMKATAGSTGFGLRRD